MPISNWNQTLFAKEGFGCPCKECRTRYAENGGLNPACEASLFRVISEVEKLQRLLRYPIEVETALLCVSENDRRKGPKSSHHLTGEALVFKAPHETGESLRGRIETLIKLHIMKDGGLATFLKRPELVHYDVRTTGSSRWVK